MKKLFQLIIMITASLFINSCYYDSIYEPEDSGGDNGGGTEEVTYSNDIAPIFGFCANCHNESLKPDLRDGKAYKSLVPSYVTPNNADVSPLYIKLKGGHQNLPSNRVELVKTWIDQGANE